MTSPGQNAQSGGRVQRRRALNRAKIMVVGEELFARAPYESVHISEVAEAADVSIGTVYTHFGNKDGLFLAVADDAIRYVTQYVADRSTRGTTRELIDNIADAYLDAMLERSFLVRFLVSDIALPDNAEVRARIADHVAGLYGILARRIDEGVAAGHLRQVDSGLLARYLIGSWNGVIAMSMHSVDTPVDVDQLAACLNSARALILDGLMVDDAAAATRTRDSRRAGTGT